jgi:hypothetical protein
MIRRASSERESFGFAASLPDAGLSCGFMAPIDSEQSGGVR